MGLFDEELIDTRKHDKNIGIMDGILEELFLNFNEFRQHENKKEIPIREGRVLNLFTGDTEELRKNIIDSDIKILEEQKNIIAQYKNKDTYKCIDGNLVADSEIIKERRFDDELIGVRAETKEKPNIGVMESIIDESFLSFNEFYLNSEKEKITVKRGDYANLFSGNTIGIREAVLDDGLKIKEEQRKIISEIDDIERYDARINEENINSLYVLEKGLMMFMI